MWIAARAFVRNVFSLLLLLSGASIPGTVKRAYRWEEHFAADEEFETLITGVTSGFAFTCREFSGNEPYSVPNYVPPEHEAKVTKAVEREIELGRVIVSDVSKISGTAAIGVVDKQRSGFVKHRIVLDLSRPEGISTNARSSFESRVFPSVRTAMDLIRPGGFMSKIDISEYYRNFPMAFHHWKIGPSSGKFSVTILRAFSWKPACLSV